MKLEKQFDADFLYNYIVHYYIDKKKCTKEEANKIAQKVINREHQRRICKNPKCNHMSHDHIRNGDTCFILDCSCTKFVK